MSDTGVNARYIQVHRPTSSLLSLPEGSFCADT